jgi:hypothetical protein
MKGVDSHGLSALWTNIPTFRSEVRIFLIFSPELFIITQPDITTQNADLILGRRRFFNKERRIWGWSRPAFVNALLW